MFVSRKAIAILLETRPNNIKDIEQIEDNIYIQLRDSEERFSMTVTEYQACFQQLRSNNHQINYQNLVTIAIVFGLFMTATLSSIDNSLIGDRDPSENIELTLH